MFGEIVFIGNWAAIWCIFIIIPLFIIFLCRLRNSQKMNVILSERLEKALGRYAQAKSVLKNGDECEFIAIFPAHKIGRYVCFVAFIEAIEDFVFCDVLNTRIWETDGEIGFSPEIGRRYIVNIFDNCIQLTEKGDHH